MKDQINLFNVYTTLNKFFYLFLELGEIGLAETIINLRKEVMSYSFSLRFTQHRWRSAYEYAILGLITEQIYIIGLEDVQHTHENGYIKHSLDLSQYTDCSIDISSDVLKELEGNPATSFGIFSLN